MEVSTEAPGMNRITVLEAMAEVESGTEPQERRRPPGPERKAVIDIQLGLPEAPDELQRQHPETRGNPMLLLHLMSKSVTNLAEELLHAGYQASADTVGRLLKMLGYSPEARSREKEYTRRARIGRILRETLQPGRGSR